MVGGLFKAFLPKFWEEKELQAEILGRKGISAKPKPKSKFSVSVLQKPKHES